MQKYATLILAMSMAMLSPVLNAQQMAKKYVLYEHFTQAGCGPCAVQNPVFDDVILTPNQGKIHHIAYHTYWPGSDPMYDHNQQESRDRTSYYGVSGVPDVVMLGNKASGSPTSFTQQQLDDQAAVGSAIAIYVEDTPHAETEGLHTVKVRINSMAEPPAGTYTLRVALVEREIVYDRAPGSNGEKIFPNVFRKMLPGSSGAAISLPARGESMELSFDYSMHEVWNPEEMYAIAFVQNTATREVLNSGSSLNSSTVINTEEKLVRRAENNAQTLFSMSMTNYGTEAEEFRFTMEADVPASWEYFFDIDGQQFADEGTATIEAGTENKKYLGICVTPNDEAAIATFTLHIESLTNPDNVPQSVSVTVISGISDLLVSNRPDWEPQYKEALAATGMLNYAGTGTDVFVSAARNDALQDIRNIYFNISWTFPALTDDVVSALADFMDRGGNLFIAGQDIAWDQSGDSRANGTTQTRAFFRDYMFAQYVDDGNTANGTLTAVANDPLFGSVESGTLVDVFDGNFYPDVIKPLAGSTPIFVYNNDSEKVAALRANKGGAKLVYMGIGLEMLSNESIRDRIIEISHNWFEGSVTDAEFDEAMQHAFMGQNYPNPASATTVVPFTAIERDMTLRVVDALGTTVMEQTVYAGSSRADVHTRHLGAGVYLLQLLDGSTVVETRKMEVSR